MAILKQRYLKPLMDLKLEYSKFTKKLDEFDKKIGTDEIIQIKEEKRKETDKQPKVEQPVIEEPELEQPVVEQSEVEQPEAEQPEDPMNPIIRETVTNNTLIERDF